MQAGRAASWNLCFFFVYKPLEGGWRVVVASQYRTRFSAGSAGRNTAAGVCRSRTSLASCARLGAAGVMAACAVRSEAERAECNAVLAQACLELFEGSLRFDHARLPRRGGRALLAALQQLARHGRQCGRRRSDRGLRARRVKARSEERGGGDCSKETDLHPRKPIGGSDRHSLLHARLLVEFLRFCGGSVR